MDNMKLYVWNGKEISNGIGFSLVILAESYEEACNLAKEELSAAEQWREKYRNASRKYIDERGGPRKGIGEQWSKSEERKIAEEGRPLFDTIFSDEIDQLPDIIPIVGPRIVLFNPGYRE